MDRIYRRISQGIRDAIQGEKKVILLYGPRQAGKTTLIRALLLDLDEDCEYFTGDDLYAQEIFGKHDLGLLRRTLTKELVFIDEAQKIDNIGTTLKLMFDDLSVRIIASGSASFDLADKLSEPLTGRTKTFFLYPLAYSEVEEKYRITQKRDSLEEMLRFGMYPKVHTLKTDKEKESYLYEYLNTYLYKDILSFSGVRKPKKVVDLLTLLALQIGQEVSILELSRSLSVSQETVERYLELLEKMFVLVNLRGFSRNLRKEVSKMSKYYFMDIGLRNALVRNFNPLSLRSDAGMLFENWAIVEKIKASDIFEKPANFYFWRTYDQQEIDLIEEREGKLFGYEMKWKNKKVKVPTQWLEEYSGSSFAVIHSENFDMFLNGSDNNMAKI